MARLGIFVAVVVTTPLAALTAGAGTDQTHPPVATDVEVILEPSDLDAITLHILARYPILSASPGVNRVQGLRMHPSGLYAHVIFLPHSESRGVRNALEAHCRRESPGDVWSCQSVELRRYVKLDSQDFEVRVVGDIDLDGVIALTDATRALASTALSDGEVNTVMMIRVLGRDCLVSWGNPTGSEGVVVQANLKEGGDAANAADWTAYLLDEKGNRVD